MATRSVRATHLGTKRVRHRKNDSPPASLAFECRSVTPLNPPPSGIQPRTRADRALNSEFALIAGWRLRATRRSAP